jgi:hypothetical protein
VGALAIIFLAVGGPIFLAGVISLIVGDRSGALDDPKGGMTPRRGKRSSGFDDQHRDHD